MSKQKGRQNPSTANQCPNGTQNQCPNGTQNQNPQTNTQNKKNEQQY